MKKQANEWMRYAKIDLLSAEKLLEAKSLSQSVAFHAHQVIEKSLKAILENNEKRIPKIHDLEKLYGLIQEMGINIDGIDEDVLTQINDVYIDSRYPGNIGLVPEGIPSAEKAKLFYEQAKQIYEKVVIILERL